MAWIDTGAGHVQTPRAAKDLASMIASVCYNDEIRAVVAAELLKQITASSVEEIARAQGLAECAAKQLVVAYDRQYQD